MAIDHFGRISRRRWRRCVSKVLSMSSQNSESCLMGFIDAKVYRVLCYDATIRGRETVGLVRTGISEINAFNTFNVKIGFVDRCVSKVLSPLIDANLIAIEGVLPCNCGSKDMSSSLCQIQVYARANKFEEAKSAISDGRLTLNLDLSKVVVVENKKKWEVIDEIFGLGDKKGALQALEPPKDVIKSELFLHQKEGLGWLVHRENSCELPPFWDMKNDAYVNVLANYHTNVRPEPLRGGIFADDIGMGKTLTLLSLIAFDKCDSTLPSLVGENVENALELGEEDEGLSVLGGKRKHRIWDRKNETSTGSRKRRKVRLDRKIKGKSVGIIDNISVGLGSLSTKSTLIVCPPSVFSTWKTQIGEHTSPGKLKVYMYHGERTENPDHLKSYDIVLTTYSTLASERSREDSPVKKIKWWRVILDEAHIIKNADAQQSLAVTELNANRRWVVTGTPIHNGSLNLYSFMAFLHFEPFSIKSDWQRLVQRPLNVRDRAGFSCLQVLMAAISLRRTKDKGLIVLPPKTVEICYVELSKKEREFYDQIERKAKRFIRQNINNGFVRNYSTILSIILQLRQICNDMVLCPSDLRSLFPSDNIEDVSNNPELLKKLLTVLQDGEDFDCPICISPPTDIVITSCAHIFCQTCIQRTLECTKAGCPLCRRTLSQSDLFLAPQESYDIDNTVNSSSRTTASSKTTALINLLLASRDQNPNTKSIVFSQFKMMLTLLEETLKAAGFKILHLNMSVTAKKRAQVIEEFGVSEPNGPTILLASLKASCTGINLTAASQIYLFEPWWDPAIEEQAMNHLHRIGQRQDMKIVRLITRNSIEERVLDLQERKKLARKAFGGSGRTALWISDFCALVSL